MASSSSACGCIFALAQLQQFDHGWLQIKLRLMSERIKSLQDWIVIADSDEFYDFDALGPGIQVGLPPHFGNAGVTYICHSGARCHPTNVCATTASAAPASRERLLHLGSAGLRQQA